MRVFRNLLLSLGLLLAIGLAGCCSIGIGTCIKKDTIRIKSDTDLNACGDQESSAVNIRIYYLTDANQFKDFSDVMELWADHDDVLGPGVVVKWEERWIVPGEKGLLETLERPAEATVLGVVANYCDPGGNYYGTYPLSGGSAKLTLQLKRTDLILAKSQ